VTRGEHPETAAEPIAWLNGCFLPATELALPVGDAGFVLGATVTEQLRTFRGKLFQPEAHARRLAESLAITGIELADVCGPDGKPGGLTLTHLFEAADTVASCNTAAGPDGGDVGVVVFLTPGDLAAQHGGHGGSPRAAIHSFPLAFRLWHTAYQTGVALRRVRVRQVPDDCWPVRLKCRSRMHYYLADREAAAAEPGSRAILEEVDGAICETSTANVIAVHDGVLSPPSHALEGVSLAFARKLAVKAGLSWQPRQLLAADLATADEVLLSSTPSCLLPATRFDGLPVGHGTPGPVYRRLLAAWSEAVGLDIASQAVQMAISAA